MFRPLKKLLKRIASIEDYLGIKYSQEEYPEHLNTNWAVIEKLVKRVDDLEKRLDEKK